MTLSVNDKCLAGLLSKLLMDHHIISISFLNSQFKGKGTQYCITFDFLKKVPDFKMAVIGSDLKVIWNDSVNQKDYLKCFNENDQFFLELSQILVKDSNTVSSLKKKFINNEGEAALSVLQEDWSSNKYKYNLPFIVRNSHKFILYMKDNKSFVKERHSNDVELDQTQIWKFVDSSVKDLVAFCLEKFLQQVDHPVNQGTLQACIDYGFAAIDKGFMTQYGTRFVGGGGMGIALKGSEAEKRFTTNNSTTKSDVNTAPFTINPQKFKMSAPSSSGKYSPSFTSSTQGNNEEINDHVTKIQIAHQKQQTAVLLGKDGLPPLFLADACYTNAQQVEALTSLKAHIESEIYRRTFRK